MNTQTQQPQQRRTQQQPSRQDVGDGGQTYMPATDQANAIATLPPDLAVLKIENESIMSMAAARPRDMIAMRKEIEGQLAAFPRMAAGLIYNKPVGREHDKCKACGEEIFRGKGQKKPADTCKFCGAKGTIVEGAMKFARNLSIRAAEMLAEAYGANSIRTSSRPTDNGNGAVVSATFVDYQKLRMWSDESTVSKVFRDRFGGLRTHDDDRFAELVCKAAQSKLIREVVCRSVSPGMKAWLFEEAERLIDSTLDQAAVDKIVGKFSTKGVALPQLERVLGVESTKWLQEHRRTLLGMWNAIEAGESTVAEMFRDDEATSPAANGGSGGTTTGTANGTADALKTPKKKADKPAADADVQEKFAKHHAWVVEQTDVGTLNTVMEELTSDNPMEPWPAEMRDKLVKAVESNPAWINAKKHAAAQETAKEAAAENQETPEGPPTMHTLLDRVAAAKNAAELQQVSKTSAAAAQGNVISMDAHKAVVSAIGKRRKELES